MEQEPMPPPATPAEDSHEAPFALLQAERKRLAEFVREQFALIREARAKFVAEKQAAEQALETRREELERQTQVLLIRLQELHEKEEQLAAQLEDAIPERHMGLGVGRAEAPSGQSAADTALRELVLLQQQLEEKEQRLQQLQAERDAALEQARQLQPANGSAVAAEEDLPDQWAVELVDESPVLQEQTELQELRQQLQEQKRRLEQLRSERDAAWAELRRLPPPPEEVIQQEAEFVVLRRQVEQERRRVEEGARDLHLGEVEFQKRKDAAARVLAEQRQLLDRRAGELVDRQLRLEEKAGELRLHEAELREMKEIVERDTARERAELLMERLRIARLREALRMEQEALEVATERLGGTPRSVASDAPEPVASDAPEPVASDAPEPVASDAPEPVASDAPEAPAAP